MVSFSVAALALALTPVTLDEVRVQSRQSLDAIRATLNVRDATEGKRLGKASIFPQVSLTAGASEIFSGPQTFFQAVPVSSENGSFTFQQRAIDIPAVNQPNFLLRLGVTQLLYDGGAWWNQIAKTGAEAEASQGQLQEQQLASELEAVRRFFELLRQQLALEVLSQTVKRSDEQLLRAKALFDAGRGSKRDVLDAEVNLRNDRISALKQEQAIVQSRTELSLWLNRVDDDLQAVAPVLGQPFSVPDADKARAIARQKRPLFQSLESQMKAAELGVDVSKGGFFPRVSAQASYQRQSPSAELFFAQPSKQNTVSLGLNISWDIFNGFQTQAQVEKARIALEKVEVDQRGQRQQLEAELRRGVTQLQTQNRVALLADENVKLAQTELSLEEDRYTAGAGSPLEVRSAQLKVTNSQLTQVQGQIDREILKATLERSLGTKMEAGR